MLTVGVDLGTSAVKLLAMNEAGRVLRTVSRDYPLFLNEDGWSEQEPEDWWRAACEGLHELTAGLPEPVAAVSFSGQMHGLVVLDSDDAVLRRAILWNDQRTQKECDYLNNGIGRETLLSHAANVALTGFTLPKILWMRENEPKLFAKIAKVMLPKDYIAYKLSGVFATDYSDASGMMLLDVEKGDWSDEMLGIAGLTRRQTAKLYASYESVGTVTPEAARLTGLSVETKVVIGGGDQAVGAVGTGTVQAGMCSVSMGTSGVVFVASDAFAVDRGPSAIHSFRHANGRFHMMGVTLAAAGSSKWWTEDVLQTADYDAEQAGITRLGKNNVYFLPYLNGERTPHNNPDARGVFAGFSMATTRADMTLACLEGVAFSLRDILTVVRGLGAGVGTARITGGGAKSPLWCQIIADVLNLTVQKINVSEGPAFGAAILAAVGAGAFAAVEEACAKLISVTQTYTPDAEAASGYDARYAVFRSLYAAMKPLYAQMAGIR